MTVKASTLAEGLTAPARVPMARPDIDELLGELKAAPAIPEMNIFPLEWVTKTQKLADLYHASRDPGWSPATLPWDTLDVRKFTLDQRYPIAGGVAVPAP